MSRYVEEVLPHIVEVTAAKSQVACGIVDMLEVLEKGSISDVVLSPFWLLSLCLVLVIDLGAFTYLYLLIDILEFSSFLKLIWFYPMYSIRCFYDALLPLLPGQSVR